MLFLRSGLEESVGGEQEYPSAYAERSGKCGESHRGEKGIHGSLDEDGCYRAEYGPKSGTPGEVAEGGAKGYCGQDG